MSEKYVPRGTSGQFPKLYPTQDAISQKLGLVQQTVSRYVNAYLEIEQQKTKLPAIIDTPRGVNLPERTINYISQAPESAKPALFELAVNQETSSRTMEKIVTEVKKTENPDASTVEAAVKKLQKKKPNPKLPGQ